MGGKGVEIQDQTEGRTTFFPLQSGVWGMGSEPGFFSVLSLKIESRERLEGFFRLPRRPYVCSGGSKCEGAFLHRVMWGGKGSGAFNLTWLEPRVSRGGSSS